METYVMFGEGKGHASLLTTLDNARRMEKQNLIERDQKLLKVFKASSFEEAAQKYYDYNGWGKYTP